MTNCPQGKLYQSPLMYILSIRTFKKRKEKVQPWALSKNHSMEQGMAIIVFLI